MNKKGLTTIEILVVIALIGIVAAISFPVILAAKHSAKVSTSLSNLRQVYLKTELYRSDYDGDGKWGTMEQMGLPPSSLDIFDEKAEVINSPFAPNSRTPMLGKRYYKMFAPDSSIEKWSRYSQSETVNSVFWVDPFINTDPYPLTMNVEFSRSFLFVCADGHVGKRTIKGPWDRLGSWMSKK